MTVKDQMPKIAMPTISVIMPAYNAAHYMEKSLPPLIAMRDRGELLELFVVDDCSPDPSNVATAQRLGASIIKMPKNGGPGAARNHAAQIAKGDILWLVDADVVAHDDGARVLKASFDDEKIAAVFGSYDSKPPANNFASQYKNLVHRYYHQRGRQESDTFWSGCGAIRRAIYLDLGGFDGARYGRPSIEDIEFGYRMRSAGWRIRLVRTLLATHLKHWTLLEVVRTDILQRAVPWSQLIVSGRGMKNDLNVSTAERVKSVIAALWILSLMMMMLPPAWPYSFAAAVFMTAAVGVSNFRLLRFFCANRGLGFALLGAAFHQLYYVYAGVTFVLVALDYRLRRRKDNGSEATEKSSAAA